MSENPLTSPANFGLILGQAEVDAILPGNLFNVPTDQPNNVDPIPGIVFLGAEVVMGTDQCGNVVAKQRNNDGSIPK